MELSNLIFFLYFRKDISELKKEKKTCSEKIFWEMKLSSPKLKKLLYFRRKLQSPKLEKISYIFFLIIKSF